MFKQYINEKQNEIIDAVLGCVKIDSTEGTSQEGAPFGTGPAAALDYALALAEKLGFRTKNIDHKAGYAEFGQGDEMVAVLGHLDIVPAGDGWEHDPFGELCGGRIYGRGTLDDKGPIIGALYSMAAVRDAGVSLNRRIRVIFGTNEETGCSDMVRYNETEEAPAMGFTPDADYPVIFSEKGMAAFVLEKKLGQREHPVRLTAAKAGTAVNLVPDSARAELRTVDGNRIILEETGIAAHASTPEQGENAISKLMKKLAAQNLSEDVTAFAEFYNTFIGTRTDGAALGIAASKGKFGDTTVNAGLLTGDETFLQVTFDCRYPVGEDFESRLAGAAEQAANHGLSLRMTEHTKPLYVPEDSQLVKTLLDVYCTKTGTNAVPIAIGGGTYAKSMENTVAFGPVFPDQEDVIHQKNEYISIDHLMKNIEIMAEAMYRLAQSPCK